MDEQQLQSHNALQAYETNVVLLWISFKIVRKCDISKPVVSAGGVDTGHRF